MSLGDDYQRLTRRQLVTRALASPLRSAPGAAYHYSNVGYSLLAVIIERRPARATSGSSPATCSDRRT